MAERTFSRTSDLGHGRAPVRRAPGPFEPRSPLSGCAQRGQVEREKFFLVVNLSHRPESRDLAGRLDTEALVGGHTRGGVTRVAGDWQEYRASLTHNNRHNRFHWAELNALDVVPLATMAGTRWPAPRTMPVSLQNRFVFGRK